MWCRRSCDTPGYDKSPSVLPPWGFFHKSTVLIIPQKAGHSGTSFAPKGSFRACKCKHSVNCHHFAALGKMLLPDFVDLNQIAVGMFWRHRQNMSCLQIVSGHHFVGATNMVPAISVASPPWCPGLNFLNPSPFFWGQNAEPLQKFLHLEIFWGFGTRIRPAPRAVPCSSGRPRCRRGPGPGRRRKGVGG